MADDAATSDPARSRRALLQTVGVAGATSLAGCSDVLSSGPGAEPDAPSGIGDGSSDPTSSDGSSTTQPPTGATETTGTDTAAADVVVQVALPGTDTTYAHMGRPDAPTTATLFGGWKCPYTQTFVVQQLPDIVRQYVQPGDLAIEFRAVNFQADEPHGDDEPRANRAGLTVWNAAPESFWRYVTHLFANQPPESREWATTDRLAAFAREAGVEDVAAVREAADGEQYQADWQATMDVVHERGMQGIPRIALNGELTAPTIDPESTREQLRNAVE